MKSLKPVTLILFVSTVVIALLLNGCAVADGFMGTNLANRPPPVPPKANWQSAPGFSAESLTKVAVISEDKTRRGWNHEEALVRSVEDQFIGKLLSKGYKVSARSDVKQVLEEIHFEQSGLTESGAAKLGRMLNASAVLIVTINSANVNTSRTGVTYNGETQERHTANCNMSARLISVEKAEILGITSFTMHTGAGNRDDVSSAVLSVARVIADAVPSRAAQ